MANLRERARIAAAFLGRNMAIVISILSLGVAAFSLYFSISTQQWPAPGSADTELGVLMEPEVCHGETEVYTGVQA